ncbi:TonB-dependent receptor [Emticicia sp. TH156]|uniref:TonB-dependent receptor n=1 Tax=Emticicia sp. TH156 TaxID=2067454 RepID=UPI000C773E14|nr:TonB-dependent receptor [Emticicia sp. TH156]PLK43883.1 TonB-dependent receptor [Emticicia sp. TH156]
MARIFILVFVLTAFKVSAFTLKGVITDKATGEPLIGASVRLLNQPFFAISGLDGSYMLKNVPAGEYQLQVTYVSYKPVTLKVKLLQADTVVNITLEDDSQRTLNEVVVVGAADKSTELMARQLERNASQLMNIVSGKAIEISPDLTVANLIQRVSGVSIERNSNGDGQYAILRGMDKRYNYTLVNGVKIPSPDNKYRYVPLDIFPSELLGRLEVTKTLTPDLEGDAVGGVVNMVMKDAPNNREIKFNLATGYNQLFLNRDFMSYSLKDINFKSPYEQFGKDYSATVANFPKTTIQYRSAKPLPNIVGGFSLGNRFLNNKLGAVVAGSFQNTYRGSNSLFYSSTVYDTELSSRLTSLAERRYAEQQGRYGLHAKLDYKPNFRHKFQWYNAYLYLSNQQVRDTKNTEYSSGGYDPDQGNAGLSYSTRSRLTVQQIFNSTLQGNHELLRKLNLNWSAVYSLATNKVPDNTSIELLGKRENFAETRTYPQQYTRRWEHNADYDLTGYLNLVYKMSKADISAGGLYRNKSRNNFYNNYVFKPSNPFALYGKDYQEYADIAWNLENPRGSVANALSYRASEQILAEYVMAKWQLTRLQLIGGLRVEHTNQGYEMRFPLGELRPKGEQIYTDILPSLNLKYELKNKQFVRGSYFRSINRPGFFELVPGKVVNEEFQERGNPDLKRAVADNFDLRYEVFPTQADQAMLGLFYKYIKDPIEYALSVDATRGQDVFYSPGNYGNATNYGFELDLIKYFRKFGLKANYTYTHSSITTQKIIRERDQNGNLRSKNIAQTRPLYGQAANVGNISLLFKDTKAGWDAQLAASYTGDRINTVSQFLNNDLWQGAFVQMDASVEKAIGSGWVIYVKANNLLDTPMRVFIKNTNPQNANIYQDINSKNKTLIREDYYQRNYLIGLRFKM